MRRITVYSLLNHRRNEELKVELYENKSAQDKQRWLHYVGRMEDIRYPKQLLNYGPIRRKRLGSPSKRLLDGYDYEGATGHLLA
jgi:hypothetical protein